MPPDFHQDYPLSPQHASALAETAGRTGVAGAFLELTKPRLSFLAVVTTLVGYLSARPERNHVLFFTLICGTGFAAGGAAALNQWMERRTDALMRRTRSRPVPSGILTPTQALIWGLALIIVGLALLTAGVNGLAAMLCGLTVVTYLLVYTPLKPRTRWAMEIGAVSGGLPPLIGWAGARGEIGELGWVLFAVLFFWQIPHFLAIAWTYRTDYAAAHFPMLPVIDATGTRTAVWSIVNATALGFVAVLPSILGYTSWMFGSVAIALGGLFVILTIRLLVNAERDGAARRVFFYSIFYLPALLAVLVLDRWLF